MIDKSDIAIIAFSIAVANKHNAPEDYVLQVVDAYEKHTKPAAPAEELPPAI